MINLGMYVCMFIDYACRHKRIQYKIYVKIMYNTHLKGSTGLAIPVPGPNITFHILPIEGALFFAQNTHAEDRFFQMKNIRVSVFLLAVCRCS